LFGCFEQETTDPPSDDSVLMTKIFTHIDSIYTYRFYLHTRAHCYHRWAPGQHTYIRTQSSTSTTTLS